MDSAAQLLFGIESVRSAIKRVAIEWDAADMARLESTRILLESSLVPLRRALQNTEPISSLPDAKVLPAARQAARQAAIDLKKEAAGVERLVDAAAAFLRSLPGGPSDYSPAYTGAGEIRPETSPLPTESYAG